MEEKDMEMTKTREEQIKEILKMLFEDQYQCKLVRLPGKDEGASA